ncbi:MAG: hypothetical protein IKS04_04665 [Clostridia bacterium]|nr:hypothetical protein [Clostridia bacterium]
MFNKITIGYGKPVCAILWALFAFLLAKGIWIPFALLALMHITEYAVTGYKTGRQAGWGIIPAFLNCLCFGFTWWLPIKNKENKNEKD